MAQPTPHLPKTIWLMWSQGLERAPLVVKECYASWRALNPGWQIIFLDDTNLADYVDVEAVIHPKSDVKIQARSDIIRVNLLARYGGVWADATCFCRQPLDSWLPEVTRSGFFAFSDPTRSRLIDAWFMAASPECPLIRKLCDQANAYWQHNRLKRHHRTALSRTLHLLDLSPHTTRLWFSYPVRKLLRAYPYMWLPYLFAELLRRDPECRQIWQETAKVSAEAPHRLQRWGLLEALSEVAQAEIDAGETPVYKLTWKFRGAAYHEGSTLHYLFERDAMAASRARRAPAGAADAADPMVVAAPVGGEDVTARA